MQCEAVWIGFHQPDCPLTHIHLSHQIPKNKSVFFDTPHTLFTIISHAAPVVPVTHVGPKTQNRARIGSATAWAEDCLVLKSQVTPQALKATCSLCAAPLWGSLCLTQICLGLCIWTDCLGLFCSLLAGVLCTSHSLGLDAQTYIYCSL